MAKRRMKGATKVKPLAKPTSTFAKSPKKPEADDMPGRMKGGMQPKGLAHKARAKKLKGVVI